MSGMYCNAAKRWVTAPYSKIDTTIKRKEFVGILTVFRRCSLTIGRLA